MSTLTLDLRFFDFDFDEVEDALCVELMLCVGLGRKGRELVVGVVGVLGGVWLGVDDVVPGVVDVLFNNACGWGRLDTGGIDVAKMSPPSASFFTRRAKSTSCEEKTKQLECEYTSDYSRFCRSVRYHMHMPHGKDTAWQ